MKIANDFILIVSYNSRNNRDWPNFKWVWFGKSLIFYDSEGITKFVFLILKLLNQKKQGNVIIFESKQSGCNSTASIFYGIWIGSVKCDPSSYWYHLHTIFISSSYRTVIWIKRYSLHIQIHYIFKSYLIYLDICWPLTKI